MKMTLMAIVVAAFLPASSFAEDQPAPSLSRHEPVIYSPVRQNPFDSYPKDLIFNVIRSDQSAYTICSTTRCTLVRNFGHDDTIRREYIEHVIDQRRTR